MSKATSFGKLPTYRIPVSMISAGGLPLRRPQLVDTTTLLHTFQLLARIFVIGSSAVLVLVLAFLLYGEFASASAGQIWRILKHGPCRDEIALSCGAIISYANLYGHSLRALQNCLFHLSFAQILPNSLRPHPWRVQIGLHFSM